jgi:hypothetical protein
MMGFVLPCCRDFSTNFELDREHAMFRAESKSCGSRVLPSRNLPIAFVRGGQFLREQMQKPGASCDCAYEIVCADQGT